MADQLSKRSTNRRDLLRLSGAGALGGLMLNGLTPQKAAAQDGPYNIPFASWIHGHSMEIEYPDRMASAIMDFGRGTSTFTCGTQMADYQRVNIFGSRGRLEIEIAFNAPPDRPCRVWHQHDSRVEEILLPEADQYTIQGDLFAQAVLNDTPVPTPIVDAVANMKVIERIIESARLGAWVD